MKDLRVPFSTFDVFSNILPAIIFFIGLLLLKNYSESIATLINKTESVFGKRGTHPLFLDIETVIL